jgi:hypothetical protein
VDLSLKRLMVCCEEFLVFSDNTFLGGQTVSRQYKLFTHKGQSIEIRHARLLSTAYDRTMGAVGGETGMNGRAGRQGFR